MNRTSEIIAKMRDLLEELSSLQGTAPQKEQKSRSKSNASKSEADKYKGCMGGIIYLIDSDFFRTPQTAKAVSDELKKGGWHYSGELISMNLLSLTRKRMLTRLQDGNAKGWVYVVRK